MWVGHQARRIRTYGLNRIEVPRDSLWQLLLVEMSTPFFIFQVYPPTRTTYPD